VILQLFSHKKRFNFAFYAVLQVRQTVS